MRSLRSILTSVVPAGLLLGCAASGAASSPGLITSVQAIHALNNAQANQNIHVRFEASVTYYEKGDVDLFVQDGETSVYVEAATTYTLSAGDRVVVEGYTRASFRPEVKADSVTFLRHGTPPNPVLATFPELVRAEYDSRRVTVRGRVRGANVIQDGDLQNLYLQVLMDGGNIDAEINSSDPGAAERLLDADVELTGAVAGKFDNKMQMTGVLLEIPSLSDVKVLQRAASAPAALPFTPMDQILGAYNVLERTNRIRVQGAITYYRPGSMLVLQDGGKSLWVVTQYEKPLSIGELVSVTGFPDVRSGSLILTKGEIEETGLQAPVAPRPLSSAELASGGHVFDLVTVKGRLLMAAREAAQDEYVLVADGHIYSAVYRHPMAGLQVPLPAKKEIDLDSTVAATGICILDTGDRSLGPVAFDVLLRSPDDLAVVAGPSLLSVRNLIRIVVVLLLVILAAAARQWLIERRVRHQTAEMAEIEHRRSRILEEINGSRPVAEIVDMILDLMGFKLHGIGCWCELADGGLVGTPQKDAANARVAQCLVTSPTGLPNGTLFAAFPRSAKPHADEEPTLAMASELVTLAVETRRLYSDLKRRSEFDLLTDTHNRFSIEKRLDQLVQDSKAAGSKFGLIYVDLDGFKLINDHYGHNVGDIYLQKVALRMKHQLRPGDMLARIGGDEFAVLITSVTGKEDSEIIAARLERCFDQPFSVDGNQIQGRASLGIAIYPDDSMTRDGLLNAADAAMYVCKHAKDPVRDPGMRQREPKLAPARE